VTDIEVGRMAPPVRKDSLMAVKSDFGDFLVFVDESGDHSLEKVDPGFPIFVLIFVIIEKQTYARAIVPALKEFKFRHWGHDGVILHSHEIRKPRDDFGFLQITERRDDFLADLNDLMVAAEATIVSIAIEKSRLTQKYRRPFNPYHIALGLGLERVDWFLAQKGQQGRLTHVVAEARGSKEDIDLELEFRRILDGNGAMGSQVGDVPFDLRILSKKSNAEGLQLADLFAYPISRHILKPDQANRAFDIVQPKLFVDRQRRHQSVGLKIFP
jgi:hypothetical protein